MLYADHGQVSVLQIDQPRQISREVRRSLLHSMGGQRLSAATTGDSTPAEVSLPYHYVENSLGYAVGGWRLPQAWQFDRAKLLDWLFSLQNWQRIKGVIQVEDGCDGGKTVASRAVLCWPVTSEVSKRCSGSRSSCHCANPDWQQYLSTK